jgi:hypothetical protein
MGGWMDGQTDRNSDMSKLTGTFHDCANVPKNDGVIKV